MEEFAEFFNHLGYTTPNGVEMTLSVLLAAASVFIFLRISRRIIFLRQGRVRSETFGGVEMGMAAGLIALFATLILASVKSAPEAVTELGVETLFRGSIFQAGLCGLVLFVLLMRRQPVAQIVGFDAMPFGRQLAWAFFFIAASFPLLDVLTRISITFNGAEAAPQAIVEFARNVESREGQLAVIIFAVVVAPVTEEFLFRGFLYPALKSTLGVLLALILTSALFGLVHMNARALLPLSGLGFVMALAYERTGSLLVPMTMHAIFNAISLVVMRLPTSPASL